MPIDQCLAAARWHHQWRPDTLMVEATLPGHVLERLRTIGHRVETLDAAGVMQGIGVTPDGLFMGAHDPRVPGLALGFLITELLS